MILQGHVGVLAPVRQSQRKAVRGRHGGHQQHRKRLGIAQAGFYGIYHSFSEKRLQRYINEFTYRLNDGNVRIRTMDRIDALLAKTSGKRLTYKTLIA